MSRGIARTTLGVQDARKQVTNIARREQSSAPIVKETTWQPISHVQSTGNSKNDLSTYVSMNSTLNILQANLRKMSGVQDALYNDQELWEFDLILMQEPHYVEFDSNIHITGTGPNFEIIRPKAVTPGNQESRARSCIWANKNSEYVQIPTDSNDIVIIILQWADRNILVASVYVPCRTLDREGDEQQLLRYT